MKKFKKVAACVLAAAMALSLAACGDTTSTSNSTSTSKKAETKTETSKKDDGGAAASSAVTINVYRASFNCANPDTAEVDAIAAKINEYLASQGANVQISLKDVPSGEYTEKANLALQNNEIDLLWTASWQTLIDCKSLYNNNAVYDLTDILPGTKLYDSMPEGLWNGSKYGGKNLFVPVYKDSVEGYDLIFRQEAVDAHGWDLSKVKSLKDLETLGILEDAKNDGLTYPMLLQRTAMFYRFCIDSFDCGAFLSNALIGVNRSTHEVVNPIQSPEYLEYVKLMCHWNELGYVSDQEAMKETNDQTIQSNKWAVSWWTDVPNNDEADGRYGQDTSVAQVTEHWAHTNSTLGSCYAVSSKCSEEKAKACVEFLGWLFSDNTVASLYTYGIEGTDYDLDENGQVVKKGDLYNHSMWESTSALALDTLEAGEPVNKKSLYEAFNGSAIGSEAAGFLFDTTPVNDIITTCNDAYDQIGFALENGGFKEADVEAKIAELQAALDAAGYQELLAEAQRQYNEWKK